MRRSRTDLRFRASLENSYRDEPSGSFRSVKGNRDVRNHSRPEKGNGAQAAREYYEGIKAVFANVARSLEPGGHVVIVVHDRGEMYFEMARELGFSVETVLERHVNRRTGRRSGEFFERVYVWRKEQ